MPSTPPALLVAAVRLRHPGRLDWPSLPNLAQPSVQAVAAAAAPLAGRMVWLGGGEPTVRADLPALLQAVSAVADVGLDTDGLALAQPRVASSLAGMGVTRVRMALHAGRADAHDWLVGIPGAARKVRRAIRACAEAGLTVHGAVTLTRPTMDLLPETLALLGRLGASHVHLRRLRRRGPAARGFLSLSPRLGLLEPFVEEAVHRARDAGVTVTVDGLPRCAVPRVPDDVFGSPATVVVPDGPGLAHLAALLLEPAPAPGCPTCRRDAGCPGAPSDYVDRFGRGEIDSETGLAAVRPRAQPPQPGALVAAPPPRRGRAPATRLRSARRVARLGDLGGDPVGGTNPGPAPSMVRLTLDTSASSRDLRQEMVRLAQQGATRMVIDGDLGHPDTVAVVRDALRLRMLQVELHGDPTPLGQLSDRQLLSLRQIHRLVVTDLHHHPTADRQAAMLRIAELAGIVVDIVAGSGAEPGDSRPTKP